MAKLTLKQQIFCDEYLIDLNATQAAVRAGYSSSTAKDIGCENLAKPNIRTYIDKVMAERSKRTGINQDRVIRELARIAFINPNDVMNLDEVTIKDNASEDDLAVIQSVRIKTVPTKNGNGVEREIKLADKLKALELLGKHLGMFTEKVDLNVSATEKLSSILDQLGGKGLEDDE